VVPVKKGGPETPAQRMRRLLRLQGYYGFFSTLHWLFLYFFLIRELGFALPVVFALAMFFYTVSVVFMVLLPVFEARRALRIGFLMRILAILPFWLWPTVEGILIAGVFFGLAQPLFWVPYNMIFYEHRARGVNGKTSAIAFSVQPFLDVVTALLAGFIVTQWDFPTLFAVAFFIGVLGWPAVFLLNLGTPLKTDVWRRIRNLKGVRMLMFLDGVSQGATWLGVAVVTIDFLEEPSRYASFFAFLALTGAVAALVLGPLSDKRSRRFGFIWPVAFLFALVNVVSVFAATVLAWAVARGAATFLRLVYDPFRNAVYLDTVRVTTDLYIGREVLLNMGRVVGVFCVFLAYLSVGIQYAFFVPAVIAVAVPIIIKASGLYPDEPFFMNLLKPLRQTWRQ
jgi:MFS family permease